MDARKELYFIHKREDEFQAPVSAWLQQFGVRKSKGLGHHTLNMHYNDGIEICYVLKGIYRWKVENSFHQVYPGQMFITCPWQWHGSPDEVLDRGILGWVVIRPRLFLQNGELELGSWSSLATETQRWLGELLACNENPVISQEKDISGLLRQIHKELADKEEGCREMVNMHLDSLLLHVGRALKNRQSGGILSDDFATVLHERMIKNCHQKINMEDLACSFGMSPSSFNKKVKFLTGFSPAEYLIGLRMKKAARLLAETEMKVIDIALECGFGSSQYFATKFTDLMGISPTGYRSRSKTAD